MYTCIIYIYTHIHTVPLCHHFPVRRLIFGPTCHKIVNNQADLVWIINPGDCTTLNFSWVVTNKKIIEPAKFQSLFKQRFAPGLRLPFGRLALRFFLQIVMVVIPMPHSPNERLAMSSCCEHLGNSVNPMPWAPLVRSGWLVLPLAWHLCCRHCFAATKPLKLGEGGGEWLHQQKNGSWFNKNAAISYIFFCIFQLSNFWGGIPSHSGGQWPPQKGDLWYCLSLFRDSRWWNGK